MLAMDAVGCELVSATNSLVSGNFAGNSRVERRAAADDSEQSDNLMKIGRSKQGI
jgi:hypothetical protein